MSEIEDRRHLAWCAAVKVDQDVEQAPVDRAIEVATQVKITDEAIMAYYAMVRKESGPKPRLAAFLAALGFEVID